MIVTLWGTRGSLACSGPDLVKYGGNTSCVSVQGYDDTLLILDAGTGIRRLGMTLDKKIRKIHILLTHLHMDHIQGLGFFVPIFNPEMEIHIYGPASSKQHLITSLTKYLSPPLFPVLLRDVPCKLFLHELSGGQFNIGEFSIYCNFVCHPGLTLGYRIMSKDGNMAYLPDHEPALGAKTFPGPSDWTSGYDVAKNVDLLLHDSQYTTHEREHRIGWGHSSIEQALQFGQLAKVKNFVTFHHDPSHSDDMLNQILSAGMEAIQPDFLASPGQEGVIFNLPMKLKETV